MDLPGAMPEEVSDQIIELIGCDISEIIQASGKTGLGVEEILSAVINRIPAPKGDENAPLQAMIFDSVFNSFRGIIAYYRIRNGVIKKGQKIRFMNSGRDYNADEIGILKMELSPRKEVRAGDVGYIISGIKQANEVKVGDTITGSDNPCEIAIKGFEDVKPMVFAGIYPVDTEDYEEDDITILTDDNTTESDHKKKKYDKALEIANKAISITPYDSVLTDHLGDIYWQIGKYKQAVYQWRTATNLSPDEELKSKIKDVLKSYKEAGELDELEESNESNEKENISFQQNLVIFKLNFSIIYLILIL
jgi:tetratricopeptide (TPR) repeat protein